MTVAANVMASLSQQWGSVSSAGAPMHEIFPHLHAAAVVRAATAAVSGVSRLQERARPHVCTLLGTPTSSHIIVQAIVYQ